MLSPINSCNAFILFVFLVLIECHVLSIILVRGNMVDHRFTYCSAIVKKIILTEFLHSCTVAQQHTASLQRFTRRVRNLVWMLKWQCYHAFGVPLACFWMDTVYDIYAIRSKNSASLVLRLRGSTNGILSMIGSREN